MAPKIISHGKLRFLDGDRLSIPVPVRRRFDKKVKAEWKEVALEDDMKQFVEGQRRGRVMLRWPVWFYKPSCTHS